MTRIKIVGLCLVAVFVLGAFAASSAMASTEIGRCLKGLKKGKLYHERYTNKECTTEATPTEQANGGSANKYEWNPGPGSNGNFVAKGKEVKMVLGTGGEINCKANSGKGEVENAERGQASFIFTGCKFKHEAAPVVSCQNTKTTEAGEIATEKLTSETFGNGTKGPGGKEPASGEAWTAFSPKKEGTPFAKFECSGTPYTVTGYLVAKQSGTLNVVVKAGTLTFESAAGEQGLVAAFPNSITGKEETGVAVTLTASESLKYENKLEIRS